MSPALPPDSPDQYSLRFLEDLSVLLVEDDVVSREQVAHMLERMVGTVHTADNGRSGLELFREESPDIVITDIVMPDMDGLELAHTLRGLDPDVPIFVATGVDEPELIVRAVEQQIDTLLLKPVLPDALLAGIQRAGQTITLRRKVREAEQSVRVLMDTFPNFVLLAERERIVYANAGLMKYLGFEGFDEFRASGRSLEEFIAGYDGEEPGPGKGWLERMVDDPLDREHVLHLVNPRSPSGRAGAFMAAFREFPTPGRWIVSLSDVTELEDERRNLEDQAATDPLTGAVNRRRFMDCILDEERKAMQGEPGFALVMFDIDHFKAVNDDFGHDVGDSVLKELSRLAVDSIRAADVLARWGGEEFMVLAVRSDLNRARRLAERLRRNIEGTDFTGVPRPVTGSFGVAAQAPGESVEALVKRVDEALYRAKKGGRNRVVVS